jgi:Protein of unknown function (DUF4242)
MTTLRRRDPAGPSTVFLVERYLPAAAAENLASLVARAAQLCALSAESESASRVQYLHSVYLPAEDTCFCLFRAATAEVIHALNDEASFAIDRIAEAVQLYPVNPAPDET